MLKNSILVVLTAATLTFAGCSKEIKYTKKIEGDWEVTSATVDGNNALELIGEDSAFSMNFSMDFDDDGDFDMAVGIRYTYTDEGITYTENFSNTLLGTWEITDTDLHLEYINSDIGGIAGPLLYLSGIAEYDYISTESYEVVELTNTKLILEGTNQGHLVRIEAYSD